MIEPNENDTFCDTSKKPWVSPRIESFRVDLVTKNGNVGAADAGTGCS